VALHTKPDNLQAARLAHLLEAVDGVDRVVILPHNDPDPDAIAGALALQRLLAKKAGLEADLVYQGIIGRAENKALVRYLGHPLRPLVPSDLDGTKPVALVDTQPGAGNNVLPRDAPVAIVLDHHPLQETSSAVRFTDVRPEIGALSTLLTGYLRAAGIELEPPLATALFYGIKTDTMGLARAASPEDIEAYFFLQPLIEVETLAEIENAQVGREYFAKLVDALQGAQVYDGIIISYLGEMDRPDMTAEMADLLLRLKGVWWALCMGVYEGVLILAARARGRYGGAERLVQNIVQGRGTAGGHGTMAGGQIPLNGEDPKELADYLTVRALQYLGVPSEVLDGPLI
jgi:nanoRNase/pAp phosphatase (c-di-AMP/oligoRNAs hydrolase)